MQKDHLKTRQWFRQIDFLIHEATVSHQDPGILRMRIISLREQMGAKQAHRTGINDLIMMMERNF